MTSPASSMSVLVPSWRRPDALERCVRALDAQTSAPLEIVVGARVGDDETATLLARLAPAVRTPLRVATTEHPGVIAAMNAALTECRGEFVALTDDDAEPRPDWLARLAACFADPRVGGAGGRDWQPVERGDRAIVGVVQWFGRVIGNHHLGAGSPRPVDVLKGVNCAFRGDLLRAVGFDTRLAGSGAQMFWELALCLPLRRAGWTLVYDPQIAVEHHVAARHDDDQRHRGVFAAGPQADAVQNETLVLLEYRPGFARFAFLGWAFLVGTHFEPGLAQLPRLVLRGESPRTIAAKWAATVDGRLRGVRAWRAGAGKHARGRAIPLPVAVR